MKGISAENLLDDQDYNTNQIHACAIATGMSVVFAIRQNRIEPQDYDCYRCQLCYFVGECFFTPEVLARHLIYAKNTASFLACAINSLVLVLLKLVETTLSKK